MQDTIRGERHDKSLHKSFEDEDTFVSFSLGIGWFVLLLTIKSLNVDILNFSAIVVGRVRPYIYRMVTKCVVLVWGLTKYCHNGPTIKWL